MQSGLSLFHCVSLGAAVQQYGSLLGEAEIVMMDTEFWESAAQYRPLNCLATVFQASHLRSRVYWTGDSALEK